MVRSCGSSRERTRNRIWFRWNFRTTTSRTVKSRVIDGLNLDRWLRRSCLAFVDKVGSWSLSLCFHHVYHYEVMVVLEVEGENWVFRDIFCGVCPVFCRAGDRRHWLQSKVSWRYWLCRSCNVKAAISIEEYWYYHTFSSFSWRTHLFPEDLPKNSELLMQRRSRVGGTSPSRESKSEDLTTHNRIIVRRQDIC